MDLYVAHLDAPTIGRAILGDASYAARCAPLLLYRRKGRTIPIHPA